LPEPAAADAEALSDAGRAINFVTGSASLTDSSYPALREIAEILKQYPHIRYEVQGHTDSQGAEIYNLLLSAERAAVVKHCLVTLGAPEPSLVATGYGKNKPVAGNDTPEGRALNRRVELVPIPTQEHYDRLKAFELRMIPRLTDRVLKGKRMMEKNILQGSEQ
jgi:outer membrane protein OmpA-like peptidoglycan-associated protein